MKNPADEDTSCRRDCGASVRGWDGLHTTVEPACQPIAERQKDRSRSEAEQRRAWQPERFEVAHPGRAEDQRSKRLQPDRGMRIE